MFHSSPVQVLRKRHASLDELPDHIRIPPFGTQAEQIGKPVERVTVDEVAFAVEAIEAELMEVSNRLYALRKLYTLARRAGALGSENAVDAACRYGERRQ
jgi:hypothetical protein